MEKPEKYQYLIVETNTYLLSTNEYLQHKFCGETRKISTICGWKSALPGSMVPIAYHLVKKKEEYQLLQIFVRIIILFA